MLGAIDTMRPAQRGPSLSRGLPSWRRRVRGEAARNRASRPSYLLAIDRAGPTAGLLGVNKITRGGVGESTASGVTPLRRQTTLGVARKPLSLSPSSLQVKSMMPERQV